LIALIPALSLICFGLGTGHGLVMPTFFFLAIGLFVEFIVLGGIVGALTGLIAGLIRKALQSPRNASAGTEEQPSHTVGCGGTTSLALDDVRIGNGRLLWTLIILLPTLVVFAASFVAGAYVRSMVDGEMAAATRAADRDDPNWRWNDLLAHRMQVPDAENAALVVDEVLSLLPKGWMGNYKPLPGNDGKRFGEVMEHFRALEATPANVRLNDTIAESFRLELAAHEEAIPIARSLAGYERGRRDVETARVVLKTPLPETLEARAVARLLSIDAATRAHDGDPDGAFDSCRAIFGVGRSIGDEPSLFAQAVRYILGELGLRSAQRALGQGEPSEPVLARFQVCLLDELEQPLLVIGLRGERAAFAERIPRVASGEAPPSTLRDSLNSKINPRILPHPSAPWTGLWYQYQQAVTLNWMNDAVATARRPACEQLPRWKAWESRAKRIKDTQFETFIKILPLLYSPAVVAFANGCSHYQARLSSTVILIAAERHRQKTGAWPASIETIDRGILPSAPVDPFSGKSLRMEHRDGQLLVYSIGPNGRDEHGAYDPNRWLKDGPDDVGAAAWDVPLRRQPAPTVE
jgi:hypothetical protein